ncbi:hypothetical protein GUITHDRAFT_153908 [Guillardia theta CCMP2712]|uniref:Homeobox domain-containing protein n=1 Tax=Guillardia theta (strain CCMP2712) TaxID=905079 RepID=L1IXN0_GUITC|nr:hypothetical protein GUITHDRAFT_153908 [Guillardia theta CCMP2712]EKX41033.1 hypothetical protein GUITHDRAFT_153908 [Guillardia theta CCMP2712]|eukprot:XP_005828013.1 hypothetical protein GUITHDRAFT_153908 [Guillardia theta CCMP2712]
MVRHQHFASSASSSLFDEALEYMEQSNLTGSHSRFHSPLPRSCSSCSATSGTSSDSSNAQEQDLVSALLELSGNSKVANPSDSCSAHALEDVKPQFLPWSLVALMPPGSKHVFPSNFTYPLMENRTRSPDFSDDSNMHLFSSMYAGSKAHPSKLKRKHHSQESVAVLQEWLFANMSKPFPTNYEKKELAMKSGLSQAQIVHWFNNARKRICRVLNKAN